MKRKQLTNLTYKKLTGVITTAEAELLESVLKERPKDCKEFEFLQTRWRAAGSLTLNINVDNLTWPEIEKAIREQPQNKSVQRKLFVEWYYAAASVLLIISCWFLFSIYKQDEMVTYQALADPMSLMLPDSSQVWLNDGAELSYSQAFNKEQRELNLTGEGYFEVKKDAKKPFIVNVGSGKVTVLGTSFNIQQNHSTASIKVAVFSGRVRFSSKATSGLELLPGELGLLVGNQPVIKETIQSENILAWKEKMLVFSRVALSDVVPELEAYFDVDISIEDAIANCEFTMEFDNPTIEEIMEVLRISADIEFQRSKGVYQLQGPGCN